MLDPKVIEGYKDLVDNVVDVPAETASVCDMIWIPTGGSITKYEDPGVIDYALKSAAAITALLAERAELLRRQPAPTPDQVTGCPDCGVTNLTMAGDTGKVSCVQCGRILWSPKE